MKEPTKIFLSAAMLAISMLGGCDESQQSSTPTTRPTVTAAANPATVTPPTLVSYPQRPPSLLNIDSRDVAFPAAKLAVIGHGAGGFTLRLCSDDPPTAIDPGYAGNSYVMDMQLGIDRLSELPAATWDFKPGDTDDSNSGIYLHGCREQYKPRDVHVTFQKNGDELLVYTTGVFLHTDESNPAAPPDRVQVNACLHAPLPAE